MNVYKYIVIICLAALPSMLLAQPGDSLRQAVLGEHRLTLQWLDNNNLGKSGKCRIYEERDELKMEGCQEETVDGRKSFLKISGKIKIISARELELKGIIHTKVSYINGGREKVRKGKFIFRSWGARKFWRMQNGREQPDGDSMVTDYIDIHFREPGKLPSPGVEKEGKGNKR